MAHILAKVTLKSGQVIKMRVESITASSTQLKWKNLRGDTDKVLRLNFDEIAAITTSRRWF